MWKSLNLCLGLLNRLLSLNFGFVGILSLTDLLVYIGSREGCRDKNTVDKNVSSKIIKKVGSSN